MGLHLAAAGDSRTIGLVFYLGAAAKKLGEAFELMTRYVSAADECARLNLAPQPDGVALEYKFVGSSRHLLRQQSEFALAMAIDAIRFASGREIRPVRVRFVVAQAIREGRFLTRMCPAASFSLWAR